MRAALLVPVVFGALLAADPAEEARDLLVRLASDLSAGNAAAFLQPFDRNMEGYARLEGHIFALLRRADVGSSIALLRNEGDGSGRQLQMEWLLEIRSRDSAGPLERRRDTLHCRLERSGQAWRITSLRPIDFFAPLAK